MSKLFDRVIKGTGRDGSVIYVGCSGPTTVVMCEVGAAMRNGNLNYFKELAEAKWPGLTWTIEAVEPRIKKATGDCLGGRTDYPLPPRGRRIIRGHKGTS